MKIEIIKSPSAIFVIEEATGVTVMDIALNENRKDSEARQILIWFLTKEGTQIKYIKRMLGLTSVQVSYCKRKINGLIAVDDPRTLRLISGINELKKRRK